MKDEKEKLTVIVGEVIGEGLGARQEIKVGVWRLVRYGQEEEPRIFDLDVARRLGYQDPRQIRKLIKRMIDDGHLSGTIISTVEINPGRGRRATVYQLSEAQALKIASRSETDAASALVDEMIAVFIAARKGLLPSQGLSVVQINNLIQQQISPLLTENQQLREQVKQVKLLAEGARQEAEEARQEAKEGSVFIGKPEADLILRIIYKIALYRADDNEMEARSIRKGIENELRNEYEHNGKGSKWKYFPSGKLHRMLRARLDDMKEKAFIGYVARGKGKQLTLLQNQEDPKKSKN